MTDLLSILPEDGLAVGVAAADWRELTRTVGAMLTDAGLAEPRYAGAMIANVERNGPYLVIAPGLALLHARPEEGALAPGLVMATLAEPVEFGHSTNDPVRVALGLTATDATGHLEVLTAIAGAFAVPGAVEQIAAATDADDLHEVVRRLTEGEPT